MCMSVVDLVSFVFHKNIQLSSKQMSFTQLIVLHFLRLMNGNRQVKRLYVDPDSSTFNAIQMSVLISEFLYSE